MSAAVTGAAASNVIDFEDLGVDTMVENQYGARGIIFPPPGKAHIYVRADARSGTKVVRSASPNTEFDIDPLRVNLTAPQARVKFYVGQDFPGEQVIVRGFDTGDHQVAQDGPRAVAPGFTTAFQVQTPTPVIAYFLVDVTDPTGGRKLLDDVELDGEPPPVPTTAPQVGLTAPVHLSQTDTTSVLVTGTTVGEQIVSATITVTRFLPPGSNQLPTTEIPLALTRTSPNHYSFSAPVEVGVGEMRIKVNVKNTGNLVGVAGASVINLPQVIRARYDADGGATRYGALHWGSPDGNAADCRYEVYAQGALATYQNQSVHLVRGNMFQLWYSYKAGSAGFPRLGCPLGDEVVVRTDTNGAPEAWSQDFQGGRLYYSAALHGHLVSRRFVGYLDRLAEISGKTVDEAVGMPIEDARHDSDNTYGDTYEFQRFRRKDVPVDTTLELRGNPVRLWVERQGGDGYGFGYEQLIEVHTATQVASFPCLTSDGAPGTTPDPNVPHPCTVRIDPPPAEDPYPGADQMCPHKFGAGDVYDHYMGDAPEREWVAIEGDYRQKPYLGIVTSAARSDADLPWTHEHMENPCDWHEAAIIAAFVFGHPEVAMPLILEDVNQALNGEFCGSDLDIHVRPLPGYRSMLSPDGDGNPRSNMPLEIENAFMNSPPTWMRPMAGDLLFAAGRWIVDCAHRPFHTEIHPPSVMVRIRQQTISDTAARRAATHAYGWVNAFYSGQPVDFDLYPPPRPSPTAVLYANTPSPNARGVTVTSTILENNRVHVHVEGPEHHGGLNDFGMMKWDDDGGPGFAGEWKLYWFDGGTP